MAPADVPLSPSRSEMRRTVHPCQKRFKSRLGSLGEDFVHQAASVCRIGVTAPGMAEPEPDEKQSSERLPQPGFESSQQSFCIVRDKRIESAQRGLWLKKRDEVDIFVGKSKDAQSIIEQVAPSDVTVLTRTRENRAPARRWSLHDPREGAAGRKPPSCCAFPPNCSATCISAQVKRFPSILPACPWSSDDLKRALGIPKHRAQ